MASPLLLSTTSADELQTHLYAAFINRRTADVALRIRGSWRAVYNLHRVVLIQSGFFRSLFTAGFSEAVPRLRSHQFGPEEIELVFDDHNITRAAFDLVPSTTCPLSLSFFEGLSWTERPKDHHPASARFLLSLLATAVYLSIPSTTSQALSHILSTISPSTVMQYFDFALGYHIGPPGEIDLDAAVGLEHVAQTLDHDESDLSNEDGCVHDCLPPQLDNLNIRKETSEASEGDKPTRGRTRSYYGAISDKIGEACVCWLARWAHDMLTCEEFLEGLVPTPSSEPSDISRTANASVKHIKTGIPRIWRRSGLSARWIRALVSADTLFVQGESGRYDFARRVVELRRHEGIDKDDEIEWTNMFKHGIYYENMTMEDIIKLSQDISPTTQEPFVPLRTLQAALWRQSVLRMRITSKSSVMSSDVSRAMPSIPTEKNLGIGLSTSELRSISPIEDGDPQTYFPVPDDFSTRFGDSGGLFNDKLTVTTMEELYEYLRSPSFSTRVSSPTGVNAIVYNRRSNVNTPASESTFFGLLPPRCTHSTCLQCDPSGERKWSSFPPCRFSVEFWDLDYLKERSRLHSQTVWYAGSLFNVYVQVVKKKGQVQMGIYLHRQSSIDPVPGASVPSPLSFQDVMDGFQDERHTSVHKNPFRTAGVTSRMPPTRHSSTSNRSMPDVSSLPQTCVSTGSLQSSSNYGVCSSPAIGHPVGPRQPYRDPRSSISAYFTISLASATGTSQTWFSSAPDEFAISQSWGWKTSSLRTEEFIEVRDDDNGSRNLFGSEVSLRATVVLGFI